MTPVQQDRRQGDARIERLLTFMEDYQPLLKLLAEREASRAKIRQAILEKTLTGLAWAGLVAVGTAVWHAIKSP